MQWNQTRADGVRKYSKDNKYYTHDHTDMNDKLNGWAMWSNFPNPKFDWDDDNNDRLDEESEVVSVNKEFPKTNTTYYFDTYYKRSKSGTGKLYETPAISKKSCWWCEYNTVQYDSNQTLWYDTRRTAAQDDLTLNVSLGEPTVPIMDETTCCWKLV